MRKKEEEKKRTVTVGGVITEIEVDLGSTISFKEEITSNPSIIVSFYNTSYY